MENNYGKKSIWKWILLYVIIATVVYGAVYYFFFYKKGGYNENSQYPIVNSQNGAADWKTYINDEHNFEIKYPSDWHEITENSKQSDALFVFCPQSNSTCSYKNGSVTFNVYGANRFNSLQSFVDFIAAGDAGSQIKTSLGDIPAIKTMGNSCADKSLQSFNGITFYKDNYFYEMHAQDFNCTAESVNQLSDTFNRMISTFKFTK